MDQPIQNNTNFELTKSQLLMWMGQKLKPESPMYNMAISFDLAGQIDEVAFQSAFQLLLLECDAMRTVFIEKDGVPQQQIESNFPYQMEVLDFSGPSNQPLDLDNWKKSRSQQIVDITACLFDSVLIKLSSDHYVWYFNQHHLITDAWAVTVQFQAMAKLYQAQLTGNTLEDWSLPKFENYLHQINESCKEASHQMAEKHWKEKMPTIPEFPIFYQQANLELQSESIRATVTISKEKADRLRALTMEPDLRAWTQHLSLFSIFSTLLYSYIYRISGQQKLAIGAPAHNRSTAEYKETPGVFIELFPLISNIEKGETFSSLFQKVRNESFDFLKPRIHKGWFNFKNGWLIYTPIMAFSLIGLYHLWKKLPGMVLPILLFVGLNAWIHYSYYIWNYYPGFGSRPMIECYPLLALSLAAFYQNLLRHKYLKYLPFVILVFFSWLNIFQSWQMKEGIIFTEQGSAPFYKATFGTMDTSIESLRTYDCHRTQPKPSDIVLVDTLHWNDFEKLTQQSSNTFSASGQKSLFNNVDKIHSLVEFNFGDKSILPGDWIFVGIKAYRKKEDMAWNRISLENLVMRFTNENQKEKRWAHVKMASHIKNDDYNIWHCGTPDVWGEAGFFMQISSSANEEWTLETYIDNPNKLKLYLDDYVVLHYRDK